MTKTKKPVKVTLACGHTVVQTRHDEPSFPSPRVGMECICWGFRCLTYQKIVKVEDVDVSAQDTTG